MGIVVLFGQVKNTASTTEKLQLLKDNMSPLLKQIFKDAYDDVNYYVRKFPETDECGPWAIDDHYENWHQLLTDLSNKVFTGNDAIEHILQVYTMFTRRDQEVLRNILLQNLKIGVSRDNFQKVAPIFDVYEVSLAEQLADTKGVDPVDGTYFASRKLDGVRCVAFINNYMREGELVQEVEFRSRQNKVFTTLGNLVEPVKEFGIDLLGEWVLDGEICILDENGDEHFDWVMKEITRKNHTIANPCYNVFDVLTKAEFNMEKESPRFETRLNILKACEQQFIATTEHRDRIHLLKQERLTCQEDFDRWSGYVAEGHWEGFMLRKDVPYQRGRNKDLLKVKKFKDAEYIVEGTMNSKITYNENGHKEFDACRALLITHKGNTVQVGSGLSKEQRLRWFEHPEEIVGKTITVQYFEETKDSKTGEYSLRFPVLKCVYENGREF